VFLLIVGGIFGLLLLWAYLLDRSARTRGHRLRSRKQIAHDLRRVNRGRRGFLWGPRYGNKGNQDREVDRYRND
jgi:hypothetical protein